MLELRDIALIVAAGSGLVVAHGGHLHAVEIGGSLIAQRLHERRHLGQTVLAGQRKGGHLRVVISVFLIERLKAVVERHTLLLIEGGGLGDQHTGVHAVLVAHVASGQITAGLLKAEHECMLAGRLELLDLLGDEFEAGQHVHHGAAVIRADGARHFRGDDRLDRGGVLRQRALRLTAGEDVVEQQAADLVAGQAVNVALAVQHGDAHAVAVRIGAERHVRAQLLLQLERHGQRRGILGVGHLDGGEIGIGHLLLGHDVHVLEAHFSQHAAHRNIARAVQRRVNDLELVAHLADQFRRNGQLFDAGDVCVVHILADHCQEALVQRFLLVHRDGLAVFGLMDQLEDFVGALGRHLAAVLPVDLIAVILARVVAGRDDDARDRLEMAHGERQLRHRPERLEQIRLHAVRAQHQRRLAGEHIRAAAGIIGDHHAALRLLRLAVDVFGQCAGRPAHGVHIHAVRARAQHAAQTGRAKGQIGIKAILNLALVRGDAHQLVISRRVVLEVAQPGFVILAIGHCSSSFPDGSFSIR